jgi:GTP-binding protein Era
LHRPDSALERSAVEAAKGSLSEADVAVLMVAVGRDGKTREGGGEDEALEIATQSDRPIILVLNKVDRLHDKTKLLPTLEAWAKRHPFAAIVPTSALDGDNLDALIEEIRNLLPESDEEFDDTLSDRPERFFVAELVREAVITHTRQEVPYGVAVTIEAFAEEAKHTRIEASIVVERDSHKGIVIGKGGARLKEIGTDARKEIEDFLGRHVFLKLWVKVVERWTRNPARVRELIDGPPSRQE